MVTLRRLEYLVAVVDHGGFSAAADELRVSQPGLSHQVRTLEAELGGALLERLPAGPRLTPLGREVIPRARALLADAQRISEVSEVVLGLGGGTLRVATITSLSLGGLPDLVRRWQSEHAGVAIVLREHRTVDDLLGELRTGGADVAIAPTPPISSSGSGWPGTVVPIGEEELVIAVASDHRLRDRHRVAMAELSDEPWVRFDPGHGLAGVLDRLAGSAGFVPVEAMRTEQTAAGPRYAAAGIGACLVPATILGSDFAGHQLSLDPPVLREISVIAGRELDPLASAFSDLARRQLRLT